jgi:NADPH:quinone reductase-like Zn-dependent oxidoreductase
MRFLKALEAGEIEIDVHAVGLNFRDVLEAMGMLGAMDKEHAYGLEASGVVKRVGSSVSKVAVGDRVVATGTGAFSTPWTIRGNAV